MIKKETPVSWYCYQKKRRGIVRFIALGLLVGDIASWHSIIHDAAQYIRSTRTTIIMKSTKVQNPRCIQRIQANNVRLLATHRGAAVLPWSVLAATQASSIMHSLGQG